jgi:UTP--glucose-1-phosphate uridylyltransferase
MVTDGSTYAYRYQGRRFDCGSKQGFLEATMHYARKAGYKV